MERDPREHQVHFVVGETEVQKGALGLPTVPEKVSGRVRLRHGPLVLALTLNYSSAVCANILCTERETIVDKARTLISHSSEDITLSLWLTSLRTTSVLLHTIYLYIPNRDSIYFVTGLFA